MMNSVSDIYLFSIVSFSVYYVFKSGMCNLTFELLHLYSFFVLFYPPVEGLCCRPRYWANIIHRFDDQNSLTSKCIEIWDSFERLSLKTFTHCTASDRRYLYPPRQPQGVCPTQSPRKPALFRPVQGRVYKHLSAPGLTLEKISVSRGEAQPFEKFTPAKHPENSL